LARKNKYQRFHGQKRRKFKSDDSHFSSGEPGREELKEWEHWHNDYKEKDCFKAYLA